MIPKPIGSNAKNMDIKLLRQNGRDPKYCNQVTPDELKSILLLLLDSTQPDSKLTLENQVDIIATVANIVLVNRSLHMDYFIPNYSKQLFIFCDDFIKQVNRITTDKNFQDLVPVFRMIFLTLYGALDEIGDDVINDVFDVLFEGFNDCINLLNQCHDDIYFQLLLIEILKCLYTLHHKYHYGSHLIQDEDFSDHCMKVINTYSDIKPKEGSSPDNNNVSLLIKNSLNFLLLLFSERQEIKSNEIFHGPLTLYSNFFNNIKHQLEQNLSGSAHKVNQDFQKEHVTLLVNQLMVLNHMSKLLLLDMKLDEKNHKVVQLFDHVCSIILPNDHSCFIYNEFMRILISSAFPNLSSYGIDAGADADAGAGTGAGAGAGTGTTSNTHSFVQMQQLSLIKELIIDLFYTLSYDSNTTNHQADFFELIGFLHSSAFLEKFNISIDPSLDLEKMAKPTSKYLDKKLYLNDNTPLDLPYKANSSHQNTLEKSPIDELSEEDKEREAEKLFVVFDRMEKLGTFENFKNPVRQWQQEGKFEHLDH